MSKLLGEIASIHYGKSPFEVIEVDGPYPIIGTGGEYGRAVKSLFSIGVVVPRKGSLGNPQLVEQPFWPTDTTYAVIPSSDIDVRWLYYNLLNYDLTKLNEATGVPSISRDWLARLKFYDPGHQAQSKISKILCTIDQTIEKTEALIEKYQHIKAGLMHDLFTRGIGADGKLRPPRKQAPELYQQTPIGWIPKEWNCAKVSDCGSVKLGRQRSPDQHSGKWTMPYLRVANIFDGFFKLDDVLEMDFTPNERNVFSVKPGDILLNEGQSLDLVGRCALYLGEDDKYCFQNTLVRFRYYENHNPFFYRHLFKYYLDIGKFMSIASQTTSVAHLGADRFAKLLCPKISIKEQNVIAEKLGLIDSKILSEQDLLNKLINQKSGLMNDLLTGKVQVKIDQSEADHAPIL